MAFEIHHVENVEHEIDATGAVHRKDYIEAGCISLDTKPTDGIATGSIAIEADTGNVYFFDGSDWVEQFSFQG